MHGSGNNFEIIAVDVSEHPGWNVLKKQGMNYSGKKKIHTLKGHIVVSQQTGQIICTPV